MAEDLTPLTKEQRKALKPLNVSDSIRYLDAEGFSRVDNARILGKRYQHIRNVLVRTTESGERRKTLKITAGALVLREFRESCKDLGRQVDKYLSDVLEAGLQVLAEAEPNSRKAEKILLEYYTGRGGTFGNASSTVTETFKLDSKLVIEILSQCEKKRVPKILFFEAVLSTANDAMDCARETIVDPFQHCKLKGAEYLLDYVISDAEAELLKEYGIAHDLLIEAVAEKKSVSGHAAAESISRLSRVEIETLKANPEIRKVMKRLRNTEDEVVSLADLL